MRKFFSPSRNWNSTTHNIYSLYILLFIITSLLSKKKKDISLPSWSLQSSGKKNNNDFALIHRSETLLSQKLVSTILHK